MSTHANSLKKQVELLQNEVELYANAVDHLANELTEARKQLQALRPAEVDGASMVPARGNDEDASAPAHKPGVASNGGGA
jgi:uncharacterized coiled-coil DUF342 family protein